MHVLVVEDDAGERWFFSEILRSRGYRVTSCASGEAALVAFEEEPCPLLLLDLMLPGMDGVALCRKIRGHPRGADPVIVTVTGREDPDAVRDILAAGADDFIRKPVPPGLLDIRLEIAEQRVRDRAERRSTQGKLEAKTRELEQLFSNLRDVFFSVDVTGRRLIQVSPASGVVLGYTPEELLADPRLWPPLLLRIEDGEADWESLGGRPDGDSLEREYEVRRADGPVVHLRSSVSVVHDPGTGHVRADGFLVDRTLEHRARATLAQRNEELAALYRVAELTLASESLEEAAAPILEAVAQAMDAPVVLLERLDHARDRLVIAAAHGADFGKAGRFEVAVHQTPSGSAIQTGRSVVIHDVAHRRGSTHKALLALDPCVWASFPLSTSGAVSGALTVVDTEPRTEEERWLRLGSSLATILAQFLERLEAEEALRDSESRYRRLAQQFQQANQELESFAYSVSHDLRAPLRTMQGFAHALLQNHGESLSEEARDYTRRIINSGRQAERLIVDLLAYSRLSFEKIEMRPVELGTVLEHALQQVDAEVRDRRATVHVAKNLPMVLGSQTALVQVISNLLSNAVKFVPRDRTPEVRIRTEDLGDRVRIHVEDNGIGIPEGQEERIFRVFERLADGGDHPGTGIGLAIVRRGMQRILGTCGVEHLPEGGSDFWVEALKERRKTPRPWTRRGRV
jgi:signal transduction histidine kinase/FixJ family two-component response regulator